MTTYSFQATGDETEIFEIADDNATPVALIPFLASETAEEHQRRVKAIVAAMNYASDISNALEDAIEDVQNWADASTEGMTEQEQERLDEWAATLANYTNALI